jgi:hypothetical protein
MRWTFVQPIVFQGIVWRCSFVLAHDLADTQAGQNRRLTVHIVAFLRRTFARANCLPVASCDTVPCQRCIGLLFSESHLGRQAQMKILNFYIAPRLSPSRYD